MKCKGADAPHVEVATKKLEKLREFLRDNFDLCPSCTYDVLATAIIRLGRKHGADSVSWYTAIAQEFGDVAVEVGPDPVDQAEAKARKSKMN